MSPRYRHIVIGGGHNGLVCAAYLARAGGPVLLLEASEQVGGAAITREFAPGFKVSGGAHLLHALPQRLHRELDLARHGLRFAAQAVSTYALDPSGAPLVLSNGNVSGVDPKDAAAYAAFSDRMSVFARVLDRINDLEPFGLSFKTWRERLDALQLAWSIRSLGRPSMRELLRIGGMNAYDLLTETFESPRLRGALGLDATLGAEQGARSPGTVLTLLHRWAGQASAGTLGIAQPAGGMGTVTQAMARAAGECGAQIRTSARVERILVRGDRACGVRLESGETIEAGSVVSNADPKTTFLKLLGPEHLDTDFVRRIDHLRVRGLVAKMHLALDGPPSFTVLPAGALGGRLLVSPDLEYLELASNPSKYRDVPAEPVLEITVPSVNDPQLAPAGQHVMSINVMFVPYDLGSDADAARGRLSDGVLSVLERHAPGIRQKVVHSELLTPSDLERHFGMAGGHWHHCALSLDQFFFMRPVPGAARYATPVPGLYLCGAGSHPGGNVSGLAGRNAARAVIRTEGDRARAH